MMMLTGRIIWAPLYFAIIWWLLRRYGWRNALCIIIAVCCTVALADQICATLVRPVFERMRPANLQNPLSAAVHVVNNYRGGPYGFPSCHAANTFAVSVVLTLITRARPLAWVLFGWAVINCYTRMYLGVHYPGDILFGAVIGTVIAFVVYIAFDRALHPMALRGTRTRALFPLWTGIATVIFAMVYGIWMA